MVASEYSIVSNIFLLIKNLYQIDKTLIDSAFIPFDIGMNEDNDDGLKISKKSQNNPFDKLFIPSSVFLLNSIMTLMEMPVVTPSNNNKTNGVMNNYSPVEKATCYMLHPSLLINNNNNISIDNLTIQNGGNNVKKSKSMFINFKPIDADQSVNTCLLLIGLLSMSNSNAREKFIHRIPTSSVKYHDEGVEDQPIDSKVDKKDFEYSLYDNSILKVLFNFPSRYFNEDRFKNQLLPTIVSLIVKERVDIHGKVMDKDDTENKVDENITNNILQQGVGFEKDNYYFKYDESLLQYLIKNYPKILPCIQQYLACYYNILSKINIPYEVEMRTSLKNENLKLVMLSQRLPTRYWTIQSDLFK